MEHWPEMGRRRFGRIRLTQFLYDRDLRHERVNGGERLVCIVIYVLIFQSVK